MREEFQKKTFKSEEDEANWWDRQQDALVGEFQRAAAEGTLGHGTAARKGATPTTTIRLAPDDILLARNQAGRHGLKYQTYLKMLIHQALRQEEEDRPAKHLAEKAGQKKARTVRSR